MTEQTSHQDDRKTHVRRPFGYRPYLVPNEAGACRRADHHVRRRRR
ncbi:MAG: hypothetical protein HOY79_35015 [Streptomyces sp.]|nr:hypothetical protein [Streptomyces sp.]